MRKESLSSEAIFFKEAKRNKILTNKETIELIKQKRYNEVVNGNIPLAIKVLKRCPFAPVNGDNIGTAMIGLFEAAKKFNYRKHKTAFSSYAYPVIKSHLIRVLNKEKNPIHIPPYLMEDSERKKRIDNFLHVHSLDSDISMQPSGDDILNQVDRNLVAEKLLEMAKSMGDTKYRLYLLKVIQGQTLEKIGYNFGKKEACTKQYVSFEMRNFCDQLKERIKQDYSYAISFA